MVEVMSIDEINLVANSRYSISLPTELSNGKFDDREYYLCNEHFIITTDDEDFVEHKVWRIWDMDALKYVSSTTTSLEEAIEIVERETERQIGLAYSFWGGDTKLGIHLLNDRQLSSMKYKLTKREKDMVIDRTPTTPYADEWIPLRLREDKGQYLMGKLPCPTCGFREFTSLTAAERHHFYCKEYGFQPSNGLYFTPIQKMMLKANLLKSAETFEAESSDYYFALYVKEGTKGYGKHGMYYGETDEIPPNATIEEIVQIIVNWSIDDKVIESFDDIEFLSIDTANDERIYEYDDYPEEGFEAEDSFWDFDEDTFTKAGLDSAMGRSKPSITPDEDWVLVKLKKLLRYTWQTQPDCSGVSNVDLVEGGFGKKDINRIIKSLSQKGYIIVSDGIIYSTPLMYVHFGYMVDWMYDVSGMTEEDKNIVKGISYVNEAETTIQFIEKKYTKEQLRGLLNANYHKRSFPNTGGGTITYEYGIDDDILKRTPLRKLSMAYAYDIEKRNKWIKGDKTKSLNGKAEWRWVQKRKGGRLISNPKMRFGAETFEARGDRIGKGLYCDGCGNGRLKLNYLDIGQGRTLYCKYCELDIKNSGYLILYEGGEKDYLKENGYEAESTKPHSVTISRSSNSEKKLMAVFEDSEGKKIKTTHFGQRGASDYTKHGEKERMKRYLERHGGGTTTSTKEDWKDPTTAGSLSRWILWNEPSLNSSFNDYKRKFGLKGDLKVSKSAESNETKGLIFIPLLIIVGCLIPYFLDSREYKV